MDKKELIKEYNKLKNQFGLNQTLVNSAYQVQKKILWCIQHILILKDKILLMIKV